MAGQGSSWDASRAEFERFYESVFPRVYALMRKHCEGVPAAEDATREVLMELIDSLEGLSDDEIRRKLVEVIRRQLRPR